MKESDELVNPEGIAEITKIMNTPENEAAHLQWGVQIESSIAAARNLKDRLRANLNRPFVIYKKNRVPYVEHAIVIDEAHIYRRYDAANERYEDLKASGHGDFAVDILQKNGIIY